MNEPVISFNLQTMFSDAVPRMISAIKAIFSGIETAPTKRSTTAKLAIRMLEFLCNSLNFLTAKITKMFERVINGEAVAETAIAT